MSVVCSWVRDEVLVSTSASFKQKLSRSSMNASTGMIKLPRQLRWQLRPGVSSCQLSFLPQPWGSACFFVRLSVHFQAACDISPAFLIAVLTVLPDVSKIVLRVFVYMNILYVCMMCTCVCMCVYMFSLHTQPWIHSCFKLLLRSLCPFSGRKWQCFVDIHSYIAYITDKLIS